MLVQLKMIQLLNGFLSIHDPGENAFMGLGTRFEDFCGEFILGYFLEIVRLFAVLTNNLAVNGNMILTFGAQNCLAVVTLKNIKRNILTFRATHHFL